MQDSKFSKRRLRNLGMLKDAKQVNTIMEIIADFGMMSDAGNKKVAVQYKI